MSNQHMSGTNPDSCYHKYPQSFLESARLRTLCKNITLRRTRDLDKMCVLYDCEKDDINDFLEDMYRRDSLRSYKRWESFAPIYPISETTAIEKNNDRYMYQCFEHFISDLHNRGEKILKIVCSCAYDLLILTDKKFYYILGLTETGLKKKEMYAYAGLDEYHIMREIIGDRDNTIQLGRVFLTLVREHPIYDNKGNVYDRRDYKNHRGLKVKSLQPLSHKSKHLNT